MSFALMPPGRAVAAAAAMAAVTLATTSPAHARTAVFGGSTSAREAIVLVTDAKMTRLKSAVIAWDADCDDGTGFRTGGQLTAVAETPGFDPEPRELVTSRNGKRRFAGEQLGGFDLGEYVGLVTVRLEGKFRPPKAAGTLSAEMTIIDKASGAPVTACRTGTVRWGSMRSAGRIYGGRTSQEMPLVVRLDAGRKRVRDVITGWETPTCTPEDRFITLGERFGPFPLQGSAFGHTWGEVYNRDDGGSMHYTYDLAGELTAHAARGSLQVTVTGVDAAGTTDMTCETGKISWSAVS